MRLIHASASAAVLLLCITHCCAAQALKIEDGADSVAVENEFLVVSFSKTQKGAIQQIVNKRTGRKLLAEQMEKRALYDVGICSKDGKKDSLSSLTAVDSTVSVANKGECAVVTIVNKRHGDADLAVKAQCTIRADSPLLSFRAAIENRTEGWITHFSFPCAPCADQLGESSDDDYLMQALCDGQLYENPRKHLRNGYSRGVAYPGSMSAQLMSFQDDKGGLYYATHDGAGWMKKFAFRRTENSIELSAVHLPSMEYGADYETPYDTVIGVVKGDWRCAADVYKSWALGQTWCGKRIADRADIPQWLEQGPLFYAVSAVDNTRTSRSSIFPPTSLPTPKPTAISSDGP